MGSSINEARTISLDALRDPGNLTVNPVFYESFLRSLISGEVATETFRNLSRWATTAAAIVDLSDGRPENAGYLAIPFVICALYEGGRAIVNRRQSNA